MQVLVSERCSVPWSLATRGIPPWSNSCSLTPSWDSPCPKPWVSSVSWWPSYSCSPSKSSTAARGHGIRRHAPHRLTNIITSTKYSSHSYFFHGSTPKFNNNQDRVGKSWVYNYSAIGQFINDQFFCSCRTSF